MRVTKTAVIEAASEIADKKGLDHVSLKAVAERLNIRTPSLYNHIGSLEELLRETAHKGMQEMNEQMTQAAVGICGDEAIRAAASAYLGYMLEHPGVYETIQWAFWHGNHETEALYGSYTALLTALIRSCRLREEKTGDILALLTGVLHGFTTLQLRHALNQPDNAREKLLDAVDTVLTGIHEKYHC